MQSERDEYIKMALEAFQTLVFKASSTQDPALRTRYRKGIVLAAQQVYALGYKGDLAGKYQEDPPERRLEDRSNVFFISAASSSSTTNRVRLESKS